MSTKPVFQEPVTGRQCGECTACCVLPRIQKVNLQGQTSLPLLPDGKPGYTACCHLCESGCSRYDERPEVCCEFECLWKSGHIVGDERRRPDNLGLMLTLDTLRDRLFVEAWELWPRAASEYPGKGLLESLFATTALVAVRYYGVPCSLQYNGSHSLIEGVELSRASRENPVALAAWLRKQISLRHLEVPASVGVNQELEAMERGEAVPLTLKPK